MTAMTPGSNVPLSAPRVAVDVAAPVRLDVSGLPPPADGRGRSEDAFFFTTQPRGGRGGPPRGGGGWGRDAIGGDPGGVPAGIEKIVVTASLDGGGAFAG